MATNKLHDDGDSFDAMFEAASKSREMHNGMTEAIRIISDNLPRHVDLPAYTATTDEGRISEVAKVLAEKLYVPFLEDKDFSLESFERYTADLLASGIGVDLVEKVGAYCALATKAFCDGKQNLSWSFAAEANYWLGIVAGRKQLPMPSSPGAALAWMRHEKTRTEVMEVERYWRESVDPTLSAQKAATVIEQADVTKLSHKKIAEIVSAMRKKELVRKA